VDEYCSFSFSTLFWSGMLNNYQGRMPTKPKVVDWCRDQILYEG